MSDLDRLNAELNGPPPRPSARKSEREPGDEPGRAAADVKTFNRITAAELATATYDIEFHIPGILVAGQPQGIFGAKKSLKTSLMLDQAIAVATGGLWLGYFRVAKPARVAVFTGESGMATVQETCLRICRAAGVNLEDSGIVFSDTLPQIGQAGDMAAWEKFLTADEIELVYVDPAYLAMLTAGNEGSIFHMGSMLRSMAGMCQRIGVTPVLLHHMKSTVVDPYRPGDLDDASWAGFAEFVRGWQLINRREKYVPGTGQHKLWLSVGGSVGHGGLHALDIDEGPYKGPGTRTWDVQVLSAEEVRGAAEEGKSKAKEQQQTDRIDRDVKALVQAAAEFPDGESKNALRDCAGLSGSRCNAALSVALRHGHLVPCQINKSNKKTPIEGYRLPPEASQT